MPSKSPTEVEIDLSNSCFMALAREAHEKNITLNELCRLILRDYIDEEEDGGEQGHEESETNI